MYCGYLVEANRSRSRIDVLMSMIEKVDWGSKRLVLSMRRVTKMVKYFGDYMGENSHASGS